MKLDKFNLGLTSLKFFLQNAEFEAARDRMRMLAYLGIIGHPVYYFIWLFLVPQKYENWVIRGLFVVVAILWLIWDRYETESKLPFRIYSYFFLIVGLPFFFTYMYFMNDASSIWLGSLIGSIFYLALIVDVLKLVSMTFVGFMLATGIMLLNGFPFHVSATMLSHIPVILFSLVGGVSFKYLQSRTIQKNHDNAIALAGSIAHELRTPILGIRLELETLTDLIDPKEADETYLETLSHLHQHHLKSSHIIDILLQNVRKGKIDQSAFRDEDMGVILSEVVEVYPFFPNQKHLVTLSTANNFKFYGDAILMSHVVINLISNALQSIAAAEKGSIHIEMKEDNKNFILSFEDTGLGLRPKDRSRIFTRFYSSTLGGAGLGLTFCQRVIHSFGGRIKVESQLSEFTRFLIFLPKKKVEQPTM